MRYVRYRTQQGAHYGILNDTTIHQISSAPWNDFEETGETVPFEQAELLAPVRPSKILCVGLNYRDHIEEMGHDMPTSPVIFTKPPSAVLDPEGIIRLPEDSNRVDYEGELAIVIGAKASKVSEEESHRYILGFTCANDVTARDKQAPDGQWTIAKGYDTFCPFGPVITDEVDPGNLDITVTVNGTGAPEVRQSSNTRNLIFTPSFLVSYLSQVMTLLPGDLILTGTPSGVGPLNAHDVVRVTIEGIGSLSNGVR